VPRTRPGVADCTACHTGHANIGGGGCATCHPLAPGSYNTFLAAIDAAPGDVLAGRTVPARATRRWPERSGFSHLSPGHDDPELTCAKCHLPEHLRSAKTLAEVTIPDESLTACRECHFERRFHWR
jgi:hypothetical protein